MNKSTKKQRFLLIKSGVIGIVYSFMLFNVSVLANDISAKSELKLSAAEATKQPVLNGKLTQGALLRAKLPAGSAVWLNGKALEILASGDFVFGFGRDAALAQKLEWQLPGELTRHQQSLQLLKREYDVQRIEGVAAKYVSPPKEVLARIREDNLQIASARATSSEQSAFLGDFILPARGPISGVYGSQRVFNDEPKRPHYGLDIAGPVGTDIVAPIDGVVTLAHTDMYYSGGTLIIDHGLGVSSTFIHLSSIDVKKGDVVKQGQKIAEMGATGRVTGPHLDWRINWFKERLDPALVVDALPPE
jgi:hypothetical protein